MKASVKTRIETVAGPKLSPRARSARHLHEGVAALTRESPRGSPDASASSWSHTLFWLGDLSPLRDLTDEGLVRGFLAHDEHGTVGVAYHGVRDAAEQSSPEASEPAASQDDKVGVSILGKPNYLLVRIADRKVGVANLDPLVP